MKTIRLLTIGNSLADTPLTYLSDIAASEGHVRFEIGRANIGGCSLKKHWNLAEYTRKHPEQTIYMLRVNTDGGPCMVNLQDALVAAPWDFVTINHASLVAPRRESYQPYLGLLHGLVRERAPQAEVVLHQTWAYREDASYLIDNGLTSDSMFARIRDNYAHFAAELGCRVIPTGEAIQEVRRLPGRTFVWPDPDFDYQHAEAPALPKQEHSLSIGWYWIFNDSADGIPELRLDTNHLNAAGCYLTGCVWFDVLTGRDARAVTFVPAGVDAGYAALLRETAHAVSRRYAAAPSAQAAGVRP